MSKAVRAKVWSTWNGTYRSWHYAILYGKTVVLYDNTGCWEKIIYSALIRVTALDHMIIAGHKLKPYTGYMARIPND